MGKKRIDIIYKVDDRPLKKLKKLLSEISQLGDIKVNVTISKKNKNG